MISDRNEKRLRELMKLKAFKIQKCLRKYLFLKRLKELKELQEKEPRGDFEDNSRAKGFVGN